MLIVASSSLFAATRGGPIPAPLPLFPANNWWNTDISGAPIDPNSANFITFIGPTRSLHPDFGGDAGGGDVYGFPYIIVDSAQPKKTVTFDLYADESDGVGVPFYPVPDEAITMSGWVEGGQPGNVNQRDQGDRHILIVDKTNNTLYELYNVWYNGTGWEAASGAFFDMKTNNRRPEEWTSADAAGLAILPGLVRYDEVAGPAEILHALRVTVQQSNGHFYPASHTAGSTAGALPMGARLRLKASKDISSFPADMQKIFRAFKKYGLIVADNGSNMYVSGSYDTQWNNDVLNPNFALLKASDFEVIQLGWAPSVTFVLTLPAAVGAGDTTTATLTAYDSNYNVATGYLGTVHFSSTDGAATLPANYTFTSGDAGTHTFTGGFVLQTPGTHTVTVTDMANPTITLTRTVTVGPPTPTGMAATAATTTSINVSWNPSPNATQYEIARQSSPAGYATLITTPATNYLDTPLAAGATYVYKVKAIDSSSRQSSFSVPDAATTMFFTDDPLTATSTVIKAAHVSELRQAVNAMRATAGLGAVSFNDPVLTGSVLVKAAHFEELRTALSQARAALALSVIGYTDATLVPGATVVRAVHVQELRIGLK